MSKRKFARRAACPFYKGEYRQEIYCEGLVEDSNIHLGYANPGLLADHRVQYCEGDYSKCPIAQMLEQKYRDAPPQEDNGHTGSR